MWDRKSKVQYHYLKAKTAGQLLEPDKQELAELIVEKEEYEAQQKNEEEMKRESEQIAILDRLQSFFGPAGKGSKIPADTAYGELNRSMSVSEDPTLDDLFSALNEVRFIAGRVNGLLIGSNRWASVRDEVYRKVLSAWQDTLPVGSPAWLVEGTLENALEERNLHEEVIEEKNRMRRFADACHLAWDRIRLDLDTISRMVTVRLAEMEQTATVSKPKEAGSGWLRQD